MAPGDAVKQYDLLCRVQSDKSTIDVTSAYEGTIESLSGSVGDVLNVGEPLCIFSVEEEEGVGMPSAGARSFVTTSNTANTLRRLPTLAEDPTPDPLCILSVEDKRGGMPDAGANPVGETPITTTNGPKGSLKRTLRSYRRSMMRSMQQVRSSFTSRLARLVRPRHHAAPIHIFVHTPGVRHPALPRARRFHRGPKDFNAYRR